MKSLLVSCIFCAVTGFTFGQTTSIQESPPLMRAIPESVGMSSERLARIDSMLVDAVHNKYIPGAVAFIARDGKIIYHKVFGLADYKTKRPFMQDDIFRIASQTKAITSTAVMMLWEEGKFRLDDPIAQYIPEFENARVLDTFHEQDTSYTTVATDNEITIRHLLTHTSGIGYGMIDSDEKFRMIYQKAGIIDAFTTKDVTLEENIRKLAELPLHHHPGEKFTYSEGLDVLGYLIEKLSGMALDDFFATRIFEPLGMEDTYFYLPESKYSRLVPVQAKEDGEWVKLTPTSFFDPDYPVKGAKQYFSGGAGLSSTAKDYAVFLQMYLNNGEYNGVRILSRTTISFMMDNQIGDIWDDRGSHHGLAFEVVDEKGEAMGGKGSEGTFSWGGYFNTQYFADPEEKIIGIIMKQTQGKTNDETDWKFRQMVGAAVDD